MIRRRLTRSVFGLVVLLALLSGWVMPAISSPAKSNITIVISKDSALYHNIANSLRNSIAQTLPGLPVIKTILGDQLSERSDWAKSSRLIIAVGAAATQKALAFPGPDVPILSVFLPKHTFDKLLARDKSNQSRNIGAVFLDQPLQRQFNFSRLLLPDANKVGVLYGKISMANIPQLTEASRLNRLDLSTVRVNPDKEQRLEIRQFISSIDFILAVPDPEVHSRAMAKYLLYTAYQNSKPIIAFSDSYVRAGALAAIFTAPEDVARQAAELVTDFLGSTGNITLPRLLPKYFTVTVNPAVARSLNIPIPDMPQLDTQLRVMDQQQRAQAHE